MTERFEIKIGREKLILETGILAKQANAAVTVQYGGTVVLVTAVMSKTPREGVDFFPLTIEYQEKTYAAGRIPGGFFKREGRPSEKEILTARLIDRPLRPLFPNGCRNEVQVVAIVLSSDGRNDPDVPAMIGGSCALAISDIPFNGPIGAVKIGRIDNEFIVYPTYEEIERSSLELVIAGTRSGINMIEAGCRQVPEEIMNEALKFGHGKLQELIAAQEEFAKRCGRKKTAVSIRRVPEELCQKVKERSAAKLNAIYEIGSKEKREEEMDAIARELIAELITADSPHTEADIKAALVEAEKEQVRRMILEDKVRVDGRGYAEVRPITCGVGVLPRTHGSALFTRGQTQSLAVTTLGTSSDEQMIEALEGETFKTFMLHYSFPPFSVGEVKPMRGPGRREIGHGALAERALLPVMPAKEEFPYTIRVVSEILESNGSSSMATVCAATLSLMDAGVPIKAPVSGVALGLIKEKEKIALLTDIMGVEDHFGDMDFKVTGTREGITAIQMDLKIDGLSCEVIAGALAQAKEARMFVLGEMLKIISRPRSALSEYAPRITILKIPQDKIRDVIGPSGKTIKKIIAETGATIDIEDDGTVAVASSDVNAANRAIEMIRILTEEPEVGKLYTGRITRLMNFGAFCEILPQKEGLIHISELADKFVRSVEDVVKIGDVVTVRVIEIDAQGRVNLSIKKAKEKTETP